MGDSMLASAWDCTILHVDLDAFFAAVEVLDDPQLRGRPVVVGGTGRRGVVASCTYEARAFGVHSAMPILEARRLCPGAVFLGGRFSRYAEMSGRFHRVLEGATPLVEPIGLDEAFLDVAGSRRLLGTPESMAKDLRARVQDELGLQCAIGVARTKLLAKLASKAAKPRPSHLGTTPGPGVVVVEPASELAFLSPLPVRAIWGVGEVTAKRLGDLGVSSVADLAAVPEKTLRRLLGSAAGRQLSALARGEDPRPVVADADTKSVGHEETFAEDLFDHEQLWPHVVRMADAVSSRLHELALAGRTVTLKIRFGDFSSLTRAHTFQAPVDGSHALATVATALLESVDPCLGVRLAGVTVSNLTGIEEVSRQLSFSIEGAAIEGDSYATPTTGGSCGPGSPDTRHGSSAATQGWAEVEAAVGAIRARYGPAAVGPASLVELGRLRVKQRGDTQWGPGGPPADH